MLEVKTEQTAVSTPLQVDGSKISFEDYLIKYDGQHAEWVDGEVILGMPAADRHQDLVRFFIVTLGTFIEMKDLGIIRSSPLAMKLGNKPRGREPDILFLSKKNMKRLKPTLVDGAADLVIEIISPESRARDRGDKFYEYEAGGVNEYWLIDPERQQAEFYVLNKKGIFEFAATNADGIYQSRVLKNLELKVEWLWQEKLPSLLEVLKDWKLV